MSATGQHRRAGAVVGRLAAIAVLGLTGVLVGRGLFEAGPADRPRTAAGDAPDTDFATLLRTADVERGAALFGRCAACHSIGRGGADLEGPNLYGVLGAPVAQRRARYAYTDALRRIGGSWDAARLNAWLTDPKTVAPGTSMSFKGLPAPRDRADLIAYLDTQGSHRPLP